MLDFSERLGVIVTSTEDREKTSKKRIIHGVYVPALRHLLEYTVPKKSQALNRAAQCLIACGGYVEAAYIGYPKGFWWKLIMSSANKLRSNVVAASVPVNIGGTVNNCRFIFSDGKQSRGLLACDYGISRFDWLRAAAKIVRRLQSAYNTRHVAVVVRKMEGETPKYLPGTKIRLIVGTNLKAITDQFIAAM